MRNTKDDRRSQRTRELLGRALIDVMQQKRYNAITVQDIIDCANVGRSTFYAHFDDKDDLLVSNFARVLDALTEQLGRPDAAAAGGLVPLFEHVQAHRPLYRALVRGGGIELLFKKGQAHLRASIERRLAAQQPLGVAGAAPLGLVADFVAGAVFNLVTWWMEHGAQHTPAQMDELFQRLVMPGVHAALQAPGGRQVPA